MAFPERYGATIAGVQAHLPTQPITADSIPSEDQVAGWLDTLTGQVMAEVGDLQALPDDPPPTGGPGLRTRLTVMAAGVIQLGAASWTEAASKPELADPNNASAYANWLWDRYTEGVAALVALVDEATPEDQGAPGVDVEAARALPAWDFPPPAMWAERGF